MALIYIMPYYAGPLSAYIPAIVSIMEAMQQVWVSRVYGEGLITPMAAYIGLIKERIHATDFLVRLAIQLIFRSRLQYTGS